MATAPSAGIQTGMHVLGTCTHRWVKRLYIQRHDGAVATAGKAIMEGAKGGCLAVFMPDAGWHGRATGFSVEARIPSQVPRIAPESMLCRMRPGMLLVEKKSSDRTQPSLHDLEHLQHEMNCKIHVAEVGFCTEVVYAQKYKQKYQQKVSSIALF